MPDRAKQYAANAKWDRENRRNIVLRLSKTTDAEILAYLDSLPNKQGYIKSLIKQDMERSNEK